MSDQNNEKLILLLRLAASVRCDYLMLCGDNNLPRIDWSASQCLDAEGSYSQNFLNVIKELDLFQHADKPTRFRGVQQSCLDLIFTNEEGMVQEVGELPPLGKSDHVCQRWELTISEVNFKKYNGSKAEFQPSKLDQHQE